jgi:hypothetical protein
MKKLFEKIDQMPHEERVRMIFEAEKKADPILVATLILSLFFLCFFIEGASDYLILGNHDPVGLSVDAASYLSSIF